MIDPAIFLMLERMTTDELQAVALSCERAVRERFDCAYNEFKQANADQLNSHGKSAEWFSDAVTSCGSGSKPL
ncbi:hypothetical protein [Gordonibacter massiliensis (ex Traore et al. 2017)]|uniref:hypothetical protein n=1 Tax=Gordonibacter massiliensis (ex Traore et al. 2017) TaxID=1841863 RepID=UPI001C8C695D|nr:hypothetical protein [Gordonibacter massiliensis (ex Traore et al. 2017)]MBX9035072.1 hypothetical protein [Gordonibacter massiliensis (ex Traore et al. 2017)]